MLIFFRRRRLRVRLSLLAIMALLWSQLALAQHVDCFAFRTPPAVTAASRAHDHCHGTRDQTERAVCAAHCNRGDSSAEGQRAAPVIPALPPDPLARVSFLLGLENGFPRGPTAYAGTSWHRPTLHPASVLLI